MFAWLDSLRADTVFGWRQLKKKKVTSVAAILSLGVAVGACTSAFRLIDALLLRPLPIAAPQRLLVLARAGFIIDGKPARYDGWEYPLFQRLREAVADEATLIAISYAEQAALTYGSSPDIEKTQVQYVSGTLFGSFGLRPAAGRLLTPNDDVTRGGHPVAVLSHDYWMRRFGGNPSAIGRTFRLGDNVYQIVGIVGSGFSGTEPGTVVDVFLPAAMHWGIMQPTWTLFRTFAYLRRDGVVGRVRERLMATLQAFNQERSKETSGSLLLEPAAAGVSGMQAEYRVSLIALSVLVALVLLISCANVAGLMAARAAARAREMALRISIGAGRGRLMQLALVESALLAAAAGAVGLLLTRVLARFVVTRLQPGDNPARLDLSADWRVIGFGLTVTIAVAVLCGLAPALRALGAAPQAALSGGVDPLSRRRVMRALIAIQVGFCFLVVFVAGLLVSTFQRLSGQPAGFSTDRLLTLNVITPRYNEPISSWQQIADELRKTPGVQAAAFADWPLLDGYSFKMNSVSVNAGPPSTIPAWFLNVSPGWLATMGIPLIDGRDFRPGDLSPGAAIVNESFANQYFTGVNPLGQFFEGTSGYMRGQRFQIVGVVQDTRYRYLRQPMMPVAYTPFHRMNPAGTLRGGTFVVRTAGANPLALASMLGREVTRIRPEFRVSSIHTQKAIIETQTIRERLLAILALFFGLVAVLLAGIGLYGALDYSVIQRRREIGIRRAIGAPAGAIVRRVTFDILLMVIVGALAGAALGMASTRSIESLLFQVAPRSLSALSVPSLVVFLACFLAAVPALLRALRIDPAEVLHSE